MTWRELIDAAYAAKRERAQPRFAPGAERQRLEQVEIEVGATLPVALRALLEASDGVLELLELDGSQVPNIALIWSRDEILSANRRDRVGSPARELPGNLLAFAHAGAAGILFAFVRGEPHGAIVAWYPIEERYDQVATSLEEFLLGWSAGRITV